MRSHPGRRLTAPLRSNLMSARARWSARTGFWTLITAPGGRRRDGSLCFDSGSEPDAPAMTEAQVIERRATNPPTRCVVVAPHRVRERRRAASLACDDRVVAHV
jgi:hypothetical protein